MSFRPGSRAATFRWGRPAPYMIFRAMEAVGVTQWREVINVGDTPLDLQAGTNAGVLGVAGVLTGLLWEGTVATRTAHRLAAECGGAAGWMERLSPR